MLQYHKLVQYSLRDKNMNDQNKLNANIMQNICSTYQWCPVKEFHICSECHSHFIIEQIRIIFQMEGAYKNCLILLFDQFRAYQVKACC